MALSYTQKTSDNSLIIKYVREHRSTSFVVTHTRCADRNPCTNNSALILPRMACTWGVNFPLTVTLVSWGIRRTSPSRCVLHLISDLADSNLESTSSSSLSSRSRLRLRSSEFLETTKRAEISTYAALPPCHQHPVEIPAADYCSLVPGTMAGHRALVGWVSLHPFVREQPIVIVMERAAVILTILIKPPGGDCCTTCMRIDFLISTCFRSRYTKFVSLLRSIFQGTVSTLEFNNRDKMVSSQYQQFWNPAG